MGEVTHLLRCPACGATNRVPQARLQQQLEPICGRCKTPLSLSVRPLTVTDANFAEVVERAPMPVLLDFWADWCGPCRMIAPVLEELAHEFAGRARVGKLNVDEHPRTAARFGVRGIPTLLLFQDGREVDRLVGLRAKAELAQRLETLLRSQS